MESHSVAGRARPMTYSVVLLVSASVCVATAGILGLRVNLTGSIPIGVYHVVGGAATLHRGDIVLACLPEKVASLAHARGYILGGGRCSGGTAPVGKIVMALPGDTVVVGRSGLNVNRVAVPRSRPLERDRHGRSLPSQPPGRTIVATDSLWLIGSSSQSFDSRYFGAIPAANVLVRVRRF